MVDSARIYNGREDSLAPSIAGAVDSFAIPPALRRTIIRIFAKQYGLTLHSSAIIFIFETLEAHGLIDDPQEWSDAISWLAKGQLDAAGRGEQGSSIVTKSALEKVYQQLLLEDTAKASSTQAANEGELVDPSKYFRAIDAFQMPRIVFDDRRKTFEKSKFKASLLAAPQAKPAYLAERMQILRSIVLRNEHFLPPLVGSNGERNTFMNVTSTTNLLGRQGQTFMLFGMLCTTSDGRYALEDADGIVGLDLQGCTPGEGIFTEGAMILVQGEYTIDERIRVSDIAHPPSESRQTAKLLSGGIDFNGNGAQTVQEQKALRIHEQQHSSLSFVFISEVHFDDEITLRKFGAILQGYLDADFVPFCFVLCGKFLSSSQTNAARTASASKSLIERYQDAFVAFAELLIKYPTIVKQSNFVFVPSQEDPFASSMLPRKALPKCITEKFTQRIIRAFGGNLSSARNCHFVSNPCRLTYFGQEIVVFRDDLMQRLLAHTVTLKGATAIEEEQHGIIDLTKYLASTILDQAHLCPLPLWARPIMWEYDHTLRLYPMPSVLVLADKFKRFDLKYEGCNVFNPSSFREGNFCWTTYYPASGQAEQSELPNE